MKLLIFNPFWPMKMAVSYGSRLCVGGFMGHLARGRACDSWTWGCEFKPHVGHKACLIKKKIGRQHFKSMGNRWQFIKGHEFHGNQLGLT